MDWFNHGAFTVMPPRTASILILLTFPRSSWTILQNAVWHKRCQPNKYAVLSCFFCFLRLHFCFWSARNAFQMAPLKSENLLTIALTVLDIFIVHSLKMKPNVLSKFFVQYSPYLLAQCQLSMHLFYVRRLWNLLFSVLFIMFRLHCYRFLFSIIS